MIPYTIQPRATAAIEDIHRYSTSRWGEDRADAYVLGLFDLFAKIADRTFPWRSVPAEFAIAGYRHRYQRHVVYWRQASDGGVVVIAVLHERMLQLERLKGLSISLDFDNDED